MAKYVKAFVRKQGKVVGENQNAVITRSDKAVYCVGFNGEDLVFVIARDMPDDFDIDYFKTYFISDDNESYDEEEAEDDQFGDESPTGLLGSLSKGTTKYVGDMAGFPIEFTIHNDGELHAEYKNVKYGTTMRLTGESLPAQDGGITFYGKDKGTQWTFDLIGDADNITGEASDGNQTLKVTLHLE